MTLTSYFFVAPDRETAVTAIDGELVNVDPAFISAKRIDPFEAIPRLESVLTGQPFDAVSEIESLVMDDSYESFVGAVNESLVMEMAAVDQAQLAGVAEAWSRWDPHGNWPVAEGLARFLNEFADLARRASRQGGGVYGLFVAT